MWCRLPGRGEFFSKGLHNKVQGTTDWASYEIPFFLAAWFTLFHPGGVASLFNVDLSMKYYFFPVGIAIYAVVIFMQKIRMMAAKKSVEPV